MNIKLKSKLQIKCFEKNILILQNLINNLDFILYQKFTNYESKWIRVQIFKFDTSYQLIKKHHIDMICTFILIPTYLLNNVKYLI